MLWQCSTCGYDNEETDSVCFLCGSPKPAVTKAASTSVCTLTEIRAKSECAYSDVTVPEKYNVIGENAFKGRTDLYTVRIHSGVTSIKKSAFEGCSNLYAVYVEGSLSSIGARAFAGCKYLSPAKRPTAATVASDAFVGCSNIDLGTPSRSVGARPATSGARSASSGARPSSSSRPSTSPTRSTTLTPPRTTSSSSGSTARSTTLTPPRPTSSASTSTRPAYTPPPPPPPSRSTSTSSTSYTPGYSSYVGSSDIIAALGISALIAVLTFIGVFIFTDWGLLATGEAWQTMLSLAVIMLGGMFTQYLFVLRDKIDNAFMYMFYSLLAMSALGALGWLFDGMLMFSTAVSFGASLLGFIYCFVAFDEVEDGAGWLTALAILDLGSVIALMIVNSHLVTGLVWQLLVSVFLNMLVAVSVQSGKQSGKYSTVFDPSLPLGVSVVGLAVTGCLLWWFKGALLPIVSVTSLGLIFGGVVTTVLSFDDYDKESAIAQIVASVLQLALFVTAHIVYA